MNISRGKFLLAPGVTLMAYLLYIVHVWPLVVTLGGPVYIGALFVALPSIVQVLSLRGSQENPFEVRRALTIIMCVAFATGIGVAIYTQWFEKDIVSPVGATDYYLLLLTPFFIALVAFGIQPDDGPLKLSHKAGDTAVLACWIAAVIFSMFSLSQLVPAVLNSFGHPFAPWLLVTFCGLALLTVVTFAVSLFGTVSVVKQSQT